ncbi:hypothetical protein ACOME3_007092 [Neoechinorhynchus agilis]
MVNPYTKWNERRILQQYWGVKKLSLKIDKTTRAVCLLALAQFTQSIAAAISAVVDRSIFRYPRSNKPHYSAKVVVCLDGYYFKAFPEMTLQVSTYCNQLLFDVDLSFIRNPGGCALGAALCLCRSDCLSESLY